MSRLLTFFALTCTIKAWATDYKPCSLSTPAGTICTVDVLSQASSLKPLQFGLGYLEVGCLVTRFGNMSSHKLEAYLQANPFPAVIGSGAFYLTDHHHHARALQIADTSTHTAYLNIIGVYGGNTDTFWEQIIANQLFWPYDAKGTFPMSPSNLPVVLAGMDNDFYRSLEYWAAASGACISTSVPFQAFYWANFWRENLPDYLRKTGREDLLKMLSPPECTDAMCSYCDLEPYSPACFANQPAALEAILPSAVQLAHSALASALPGYGQGPVTPVECS